MGAANERPQDAPTWRILEIVILGTRPYIGFSNLPSPHLQNNPVSAQAQRQAYWPAKDHLTATRPPPTLFSRTPSREERKRKLNHFLKPWLHFQSARSNIPDLGLQKHHSPQSHSLLTHLITPLQSVLHPPSHPYSRWLIIAYSYSNPYIIKKRRFRGFSSIRNYLHSAKSGLVEVTYSRGYDGLRVWVWGLGFADECWFWAGFWGWCWCCGGGVD